jgi:hypothetical protein
MKILPVRAVLFGADGRTDGHTDGLARRQTHGEVNSHFSQFCERVKTCSLLLDNSHVTVAGRYEAR